MARKEKYSADGGAEFETYIVTGLLRLMRKTPYESIKVTDIVREAGVSRMTYYRHFKSKSEVLGQPDRLHHPKRQSHLPRKQAQRGLVSFLAGAFFLCRQLRFRLKDHHRFGTAEYHPRMSESFRVSPSASGGVRRNFLSAVLSVGSDV